MPVPQKFPPQADIERIAEETKYHSLFNCEFYNTVFKRTWFLLKEFFKDDIEKMNVLSVTMDLTPSLVGAGSDFLLGEDVKIEVHTKNGPDEKVQRLVDQIVKRNDLQRRLHESSKPFQYVGHTQFRLNKEIVNGKAQAVIQEIPFHNYFPDWTNVPVGGRPTRYFIAAYIRDPEASLPVNKYIYVEEHTKGEVRYSLFTCVDNRTGNQVSFNEVPGLLPNLDKQTVEGLTVVQKTNIDEFDIVEIDCEKTVTDKLGQSLLKPVRPLLDEINTRVTQISLQMFKHLDPILQVPKTGVPLDEAGNVQRKKLEVYLLEQGDPDARYITNDNPMIEEAFKYLDLLIEKVAKLTRTPQAFLMSDEKGGVESVEALRTRFMLFLKRIRSYQKAYSVGLEKLLRLALKIEGVSVPEDMEFKFTFDYGLPKDMGIDATTWSTAVSGGFASVEAAVRAFQGLEGKALEEELARIKKDHEFMPPLDINRGDVANEDGNDNSPDDE